MDRTLACGRVELKDAAAAKNSSGDLLSTLSRLTKSASWAVASLYQKVQAFAVSTSLAAMNFMAACCQVAAPRPLQPLAQALDVFVRLVLLLVHFQQPRQDFDATLFLHHALSVFSSRTTALYRAFVAVGLELLFTVLIVVGFFSCLLVG